MKTSNALSSLLQLALCVGLPLATPTVPAQNATTVRFGVVPLEDKVTVFKQFQPLAKYLSAELGVEVKLVIGQDYQATIDALGKNDVQFAYLTPTTYPKCERQYADQGIQPLARFLENGKGTYRSCLIVPAGSSITEVKELKGKRIAFGSKDSTGSHLMPRSALVASQIDPDKDLTQYKFLGSHTDVAEAVALGKFDAGGVKDSVAEKYQRQNQVKIIFTSQEIPEFPICANKNVDRVLVDKLTQALLKLDLKSENGKIILTSINAKYSGSESAKSSDYDIIRNMIKTLYDDKFYER